MVIPVWCSKEVSTWRLFPSHCQWIKGEFFTFSLCETKILHDMKMVLISLTLASNFLLQCSWPPIVFLKKVLDWFDCFTIVFIFSRKEIFNISTIKFDGSKKLVVETIDLFAQDFGQQHFKRKKEAWGNEIKIMFTLRINFISLILNLTQSNSVH